MGPFGTTEIIVVVLIILILFGGKKIPELMRGLGTGVKEFKKATDVDNDVDDRSRGYDRLADSRADERRLEENRLDDRRREERRLEDERRYAEERRLEDERRSSIR